jgi:high-affinity iron transporter
MSADEEGLFNIAIATIFAREILEGALIIGNYRMCIIKNEAEAEEVKKKKLRAVTIAAVCASFVAALVIIGVAIPLGILSNELDVRVSQVVEGVAKVVGAVAVLGLSLKIPTWLGLYKKIPLLPWKKHLILWCNGSYEEKTEKDVVGVTLTEIRFNVAWNIWREVAECGVFLIPFFLQGTLEAIPISAFVGTVISTILGLGIYLANHRLENKVWLAAFMSGLMLQLSVGLFTLGCNEFEIVWGMTPTVYEIQGDFWYDKSLPMTILRPFGYSSTRTVLQICCFWIWMAFGLFLHYVKWRNTKIATLQEDITAEALQSGSDSAEEDQESDLVKVVLDV